MLFIVYQVPTRACATRTTFDSRRKPPDTLYVIPAARKLDVGAALRTHARSLWPGAGATPDTGKGKAFVGWWDGGEGAGGARGGCTR